MASFSAKFNKNGVNFGIDTKDFKFVKLKDLYNDPNNGGSDVIHSIHGVWVHKSPLGESPVVIDEFKKQLVNLPEHMTDTVRQILSDPEAVQAIKDGKVGYTIYEYEARGKKCYSIRFVDL